MLDLSDIVKQAKEAILNAKDLQSLDVVRIQYLGKKGQLTEVLKTLSQLSEEERPKMGQIVNQAKEQVQNFLSQRNKELKQEELNRKLSAESIDITLPGRGGNMGSLHPVTRAMNRAVDILSNMGFVFASGPEIETDYYNFTALNIPMHHPVRSPTDTFYFANGHALRPQTSTVQIRYMEAHKPPLRIIVPGKVFRRDFDATHSPMFHQLEGLLVDKRVTFCDLKGVMINFLKQFFDDTSIKVRFRPSYFPFTEPSAEPDVQLPGSNKWLEVGGCGIVHPNVFKHTNIDPEQYTGYAFGFGVDRLAMLYYRIDDIRLFFENDLRFLRQF